MENDTIQVNVLLQELKVHQIELEMQNQELKRANLQAGTAMDKYYEIYENSPIGYFTIDGQGRILEVNQAGADILGVENRFLLKNYFQNFLTEDCLPLYTNLIKNVVMLKTNQKCEMKLCGKDKGQFNVKIMGSPAKGVKNDTNCIWLSVLDITDHIMAEEAREAVRKVHEEENNRLLNRGSVWQKMH